jgi:hypothetical protein
MHWQDAYTSGWPAMASQHAGRLLQQFIRDAHLTTDIQQPTGTLAGIFINMSHHRALQWLLTS